uniref:Plastid light harvesting protein n=1 Tax=Aureoumbra lagunensis TaxID=44058 RepID=A0A7S3NGC9_9STRA|mmetsp:Transcript_3250/g.4503  ORF Transcript_3250/g.4503 Transcript_3250/m.4503 type:complete len:225 (-) Transcript_3250:56-730(-)
MMRLTVLALALVPGSGLVSAPLKQRISLISRHSQVSEEETVETAPVVEEAPAEPQFDIKELPGVSAPFGFFDPLGLTNDMSEARILYFREAEIKHGRVAMLAAFGFPIAEQFHPLFGGQIDVPSYIAYQQTPLQTFWPLVVLYIGVIEIFSVFTFISPFENGEYWQLKPTHKSGDFDWDPLDFKPTNPTEYKEMATKEINNGRLAMIAIAGMVVQELVTGTKLF